MKKIIAFVFAFSCCINLGVAANLLGDVNNDGTVNGLDSILLNRYNAGWDVDIDFKAADVNQDGQVNGFDSILLNRYNAGWEDVFENEHPAEDGQLASIQMDVTPLNKFTFKPDQMSYYIIVPEDTEYITFTPVAHQTTDVIYGDIGKVPLNNKNYFGIGVKSKDGNSSYYNICVVKKSKNLKEITVDQVIDYHGVPGVFTLNRDLKPSDFGVTSENWAMYNSEYFVEETGQDVFFLIWADSFESLLGNMNKVRENYIVPYQVPVKIKP